MRQLARAEAVNDFTEFLLTDSGSDGKALTTNELLQRGEQIARRQDFGDSSRAELFMVIGRQYQHQGESARAQRLLEEAYQSSRGLPEPSVRGKVSCSLASVLARQGEPARAMVLMREGLSDLPSERQFLADRVYCLLRAGEVSGYALDTKSAIAQVEEALRLMRGSALRSKVLELDALIDLAESYRIAGRNREAISMFEEASVLITALGRGQTSSAVALFNNWGMSLWFLGRPLDAEKALARSIAVLENPEGTSAMTLTNYARVLSSLNRNVEAAAMVERAYASAQQQGEHTIISQSLLVRGSVYHSLGDLPKALQMVAEAEARCQRSLPPNHIAFSAIRSLRWQISQARGELPEALDLANQAVAIAEAAGDGGRPYLPDLLVRRSIVELLLGHSDRAATDAARALEMLRKAAQPGTFSRNLGGAYLAYGQALQARGQGQEARSAFASALEHYEPSLGADHPETRAARRLAGAPTP